MKSFLALALILTACSCHTTVVTSGVPNLHCVDTNLNIWRGGQPTDQGWHYLHDALHLTTDVKLNTESEGGDAGAAASGMRVVYCPMTAWQQTFGPVMPQLTIALTNVVPGTYVHCEHGVNRTGTVIGMYRVARGWKRSAARKEMDSYGWNSSLPALRDAWEDWKP